MFLYTPRTAATACAVYLLTVSIDYMAFERTFPTAGNNCQLRRYLYATTCYVIHTSSVHLDEYRLNLCRRVQKVDTSDALQPSVRKKRYRRVTLVRIVS